MAKSIPMTEGETGPEGFEVALQWPQGQLVQTQRQVSGPSVQPSYSLVQSLNILRLKMDKDLMIRIISFQ